MTDPASPPRPDRPRITADQREHVLRVRAEPENPTIEEISRRCGVSRSSVSKILSDDRGRHAPSEPHRKCIHILAAEMRIERRSEGLTRERARQHGRLEVIEMAFGDEPIIFGPCCGVLLGIKAEH